MKAGIGIDVGSHTAKLVAGREKGGAFQVLTFAGAARSLSTSGQARDTPAEAVSELVAEAQPKKAAAVVGLTGRDVMIRYSQAPDLPVNRLKVLMDFEVQEISEKIEGEVAADYNVLPGELGDGGEQMVLIAMAKESYLAPRVDACHGEKLAVRYATPNMLAITNAFLKLGSFQEGETTLHLDLGHENADLAIQQNGDLLFARNLAFGGRHFTEALEGQFGVDFAKAEDIKRKKGSLPVRGESGSADGLGEKSARALSGVLGQLVGLVQSSISFCKVQWKRSDLKVGRVILSGGASVLPNLPRALSENLGVPVEVFDPTDRLDLSALEPDDAKELRRDAPAYVVAIGLALMAMDPRFFSVQILPAALQRRKVLRERTSFLVAAGVLAVAYLAASVVIGGRDLEAAEERHGELSRLESQQRRDVARYEESLAENREKIARLELLQRQTAPGFALARTLDAVQTTLQGFEGLWIRGISLEERKAKSKEMEPPPVVVIEGAGIETDDDVSRVANRFAAELKRHVADEYGARAQSSFNQRRATFEIVLDFFPDPEETEDVGEE